MSTVITHDKTSFSENKDDTAADIAEQATSKGVGSVADEVCPDHEFFADKTDDDIEVNFISNYAEEDVVIDSLKELFEDNLLPSLPKLISKDRVDLRSVKSG